MPKYQVTSPDGTKYEVTAPDGATQDQVMSYVQSQHQAKPAEATPQWQTDLANAAENTIPGLGAAMPSIIDSARALPGGLMQGVTALAGFPGDIQGMADNGLRALGLGKAVDIANAPRILPRISAPTSATLNDIVSKPTGGYYEPKTVAGDYTQTAASFLPAAIGGAGSLASRIGTRVLAPALGSTIAGQLVPKSSPYYGLARAGGSIAGALAPGAISAGAGYLGRKVVAPMLGVSTGVGSNAITGAYQAGAQGGDAASAFTGNLRGNVPPTDVVDQAREALANMRVERGAAYRSGMQDISKDATVLDFKPIDQAVEDATNIKTFKGQDLSPATKDVRDQISATINSWRGLDPAEYHTPEGIDALKQQIGDIKDAQAFGTPQRAVATQIYGAIRQTIADQAPTYDKVMSNYSRASDLLETLQKELSLKPGTNPAATLKKLQSVMRNNVNTSWGYRADLANTLQDNGASTLMPSLAGQALSPSLPRGMAQFTTLPAAAVGAGMGVLAHNPAAAIPLALSSPRVVGEGAFAAGSLARVLRELVGTSASPVTGLTGVTMAPYLARPYGLAGAH